MEARNQAVRELWVHVLADAEAVKMQAFRAFPYKEAVALSGLPDHHTMLIIVKTVIAFHARHLNTAVGLMKIDFNGVHILPRGAKSKCDRIPWIRFLRNAILCCPRGIQCLLIDRTLCHTKDSLPTLNLCIAASQKGAFLHAPLFIPSRTMNHILLSAVAYLSNSTTPMYGRFR